MPVRTRPYLAQFNSICHGCKKSITKDKDIIISLQVFEKPVGKTVFHDKCGKDVKEIYDNY